MSYNSLLPDILALDNSTCVYCGERNRKLTIDHILPQSRGGGHAIENLAAACERCNYTKGTRTPYEWGVLPKYGRFATQPLVIKEPIRGRNVPVPEIEGGIERKCHNPKCQNKFNARNRQMFCSKACKARAARAPLPEPPKLIFNGDAPTYDDMYKHSQKIIDSVLEHTEEEAIMIIANAIMSVQEQRSY
jgi:hypothetical protein